MRRKEILREIFMAGEIIGKKVDAFGTSFLREQSDREEQAKMATITVSEITRAALIYNSMADDTRTK